MATRFYLGRESFTAMDPGTLGTWDVSYKQRYKMETVKNNTSFTTYTITGMSGTQDTLMRQFISLPMQAGTTVNSSTTWTFTCRYKESSTALNIFPMIYGSFIDTNGDPVGYQFTANGGTEFSTTLTARQLSFTGLTGSYTTANNDRLVLEVGWRKNATTSGSASISLGDNDASDLSGDGDTGTNNPWFEVSSDFTFNAEGTPDEQAWTVSSYISGVLDEWR